ncbi:MAG TPA: DNA polymerase/3'-5' exonuclease PolX [Candidatus Saccharimonadales bacterium]|nr:DNA polymerase/3'-5' exonuclease PolX [Candidatus Saccharimonadales bacterium]
MPREYASEENARVADLLDEIGDLLELKGENVFRAVTYRAAAREIRDLREPIRTIYEAGHLAIIPKVGASVGEAIAQYLQGGKAKRHEELKAAVPEGLLTLLRVKGVGPATARLINQHLKITTIDELEAAAKDGRLRSLPKIQAKTEENILKSIASLRQRTGRSLINFARTASDRMVAYLRETANVSEISVCGSLRRWKETIGDIDLLVASDQAAPIMAAFTGAPNVERILAQGETKSSVIVERGLQIDLRVVPAAAWGAALLYFTGSKEHNVRLRGFALRKKLLLNEYGLYRVGEEKSGTPVASRTEEEIYAALGMDWIPPELREDHGEIDAALAHRLPALVAVGDLKGDLHTHSDWTDGRDTLTDMVRRARDKGYEYVAVTDHSVGLGMTNGLNLERIAARNKVISKLNQELAPFRVLIGTEVEIRADGRLDYPDDVLAGFEIVTASIHSAFNQPREQITGRLVGAMKHPLVTAISHPTGRLLERRDPYDVDLDAVIAAAVTTGTRLEVNGGPERLDLPDWAVRKAVEQGATLVIDSDAHAIEELDWTIYGAATARRGWATADRVGNTRGLDAVLRRKVP